MGEQPRGSDGYMHPSSLLAAVNEFIDEDTIVVADGDILVCSGRIAGGDLSRSRSSGMPWRWRPVRQLSGPELSGQAGDSGDRRRLLRLDHGGRHGRSQWGTGGLRSGNNESWASSATINSLATRATWSALILAVGTTGWRRGSARARKGREVRRSTRRYRTRSKQRTSLAGRRRYEGCRISRLQEWPGRSP